MTIPIWMDAAFVLVIVLLALQVYCVKRERRKAETKRQRIARLLEL